MKPKLRTVTATPMRAVNAGESRSCVGSENDMIARAYSLLIGVIGEPPAGSTTSRLATWCRGLTVETTLEKRNEDSGNLERIWRA